MALDADSGKLVWEYKFNIFQSDVPPHRVGWASPAADPETGNVYALSVGASADRPERRRQAVVAAIDRRGVRGVYHARWPDDVADRRWRSGHRQRGGLELGHTGEPRPPVHRAQQTHRRDRLRRQSWRPAVRYGVRGPDDRDGQRHAPAHRRPGRRRHSRHQVADRRKGVELRRSQARHQHRRRGQRQHRDHLARRREPHRQRDGDDRRHRRIADRRHQGDEVGALRRAVRLLVAARRRFAPLSD